VLQSLLVEYINDPDSSWICGRFGAVAEFHRDREEKTSIATAPMIMAATDRGAMRLELMPELHAVAYETVSKCTSWGQGVALCLPERTARMSGRTVVTELGPDCTAVRAEDREACLFDLGLGGRYTEICVRSADPDTLALLRGICGLPLFTHGHAFLHRLPQLSPHRVFTCRLGRVEVFQKVPPADGKSPDGPHTHVRANLLALRRNHAATVPIPEGSFAGMSLYPAHPLRRAGDGQVIDFDPARYEAFQQVLKRYGDPALLRGKAAAHDSSATEADLSTRPERIGFRIGRRQRKWVQAS
jgi:hypothetical protein